MINYANKFLRMFGVMLIPIDEIERFESTAAADYRYAQRDAELDERDRGYFNGMADKASRIAHDLRVRYLS